jgi:hypothetical protein
MYEGAELCGSGKPDSRKFYYVCPLAVKLTTAVWSDPALSLLATQMLDREEETQLMRTAQIMTLGVVLGLAAAPAFAQRRARSPVPDTGMIGIGASFAAAVPTDPSLENGPQLAGNVEGYLTPRLSVRAQVGGGWRDITGRGFTGSIKPVFLDGNIVYNWEGGVLHPFATGGIGVYRYRSAINGAPEFGDTKAGFDFGGGVEYFLNRYTTLTTELLYHKVDNFNTPVGVFNEASFWAFSVGVKKYLGR